MFGLKKSKENPTPKLKVILISVLFVMACCIMPESETDSTKIKDTQIVIETESS